MLTKYIDSFLQFALERNTTYLLTPKARKKGEKDRILGASTASLIMCLGRVCV